MKSFKISIIVPVYNAAKYLFKCLDSLINQTLDDIEIICINDGSIDGSYEILKTYSEKYENINIFTQENKGAGAARNLGLKNAKGEYICFVDADDWVEENAYEILYNCLKTNNLDILMFKMNNYDNETEELYATDYYNLNPLNKFENGEIFTYKEFDLFKVAVSTCNKIYNNKFLKKTNIRFPEGLIFEDNIFYYSSVLEAKKISLCDQYLYFRRRIKNSVMGLSDRKHFDIIPISNLIIDIFKSKNLYEEYKKNLLNKKITLIRSVYDNFDENLRKDFLKLIKEDFFKTIENYYLYEEYKLNLEKINLDFFLNSFYSDNPGEFDFLNLKSYSIDLKNKYELLNENHNNLKLHHKYLNKSNNELKKMNKDLKRENKEIKKQNKLLGNKNYKINEKYEKELTRIYKSKSWKITKPLRKIMNKIR